MITVVALHWLDPKKREEGIATMRGISETAKGAKGLVSRFVLISTTNPDLWTTVTVWQTKEDYRNYWDGPTRPKRPANVPAPFARMDIDVYEVDNSMSLNITRK